MDYYITGAQLQDLDAVAAVERASFPPAEAAGRETLLARLKSFPQSFLIACSQEDDKVLGLIDGGATNQRTITDDLFSNAQLHDPSGAYQAIYGLAVLPGYRQRGIATELLRHMIKLARQQARAGVILTCKNGLIPYYTAFGFECLGVSSSVHGGARWYDMLLSLPRPDEARGGISEY